MSAWRARCPGFKTTSQLLQGVQQVWTQEAQAPDYSPESVYCQGYQLLPPLGLLLLILLQEHPIKQTVSEVVFCGYGESGIWVPL